MVLLGRLRGGPTSKHIAFFSIKDGYYLGLKSPFKATFLGEEDLKRRSRKQTNFDATIEGWSLMIFNTSENQKSLASTKVFLTFFVFGT